MQADREPGDRDTPRQPSPLDGNRLSAMAVRSLAATLVTVLAVGLISGATGRDAGFAVMALRAVAGAALSIAALVFGGGVLWTGVAYWSHRRSPEKDPVQQQKIRTATLSLAAAGAIIGLSCALYFLGRALMPGEG